MIAVCNEWIDPSSSVSVVIPTYNRASTLPRALASVFRQTYKARQVIVVDDASTDDTEAIIAPLLTRGVIYRRQPQNMGASAARNAGAKICDGEFIAFLDSDDELTDDNFIQKLQALVKGGTASVLSYCPSLIIGEDIRLLVDNIPPENWNRPFSDRNFVGGASQCMVNAAAFRSAGGFDEQLAVAEDWDLWIRLAKFGAFSFAPGTHVIRYVDSEHRLSRNWEKRIRGLWHIYVKYARPIERSGGRKGSELALEIGDTLYQLRLKNWARRAYRSSLAGERRPRVMFSLILTYIPISAATHLKFVWFVSGVKSRALNAFKYHRAYLSPFRIFPQKTQ